LDGLLSDITLGIHDIILTGTVTNINRRDTFVSTPQFNVRMQGLINKMSLCSIRDFNPTVPGGHYSDITCSNFTQAAPVGASLFSNIRIGFFITTSTTIGTSNHFSSCVFASLTGLSIIVAGDNNKFTGCFFSQPGPGPAPIGATVVSGSKNLFSGCAFADTDSPVGAESCLFITGSDNVVSGCGKTATPSGILSGTRNFEISGAGAVRNIITGTNLIGSTTGAPLVHSSINILTAGVNTMITNNIVDTAIIGAGGAGSIVTSNIVA